MANGINQALWLDSPNANLILERESPSQYVFDTTTEIIKKGYAHIPKALSHEQCDKIVSSFKQYCDENYKDSEPFLLPTGNHSRLCNFHLKNADLADAITSSNIMGLLDFWFKGEAAVCSSLLFEQSSEQALHRDSPFFCTDPYGLFFGVWFALEDVHEDAGPLTYYEGGHKLFVDHKKIGMQNQNTGEMYQAYVEQIKEECEKSCGAIRRAIIQKGDAFIWHPELPHGGSKIQAPGLTRYSAVFHCMPRVTPVYGIDEFFGLKKADGRKHKLKLHSGTGRAMIDHGAPVFANNY